MPKESPGLKPFAYELDVSGLARGQNTTVRFTASEGERNGLARDIGIETIHRLDVDMVVSCFKKKSRVKVEGTVSAEIGAACVVCLEPVVVAIDEVVSRLYEQRTQPESATVDEIYVDPGEDDVDVDFDGQWIDLGAIVEETLSLAIPAHPRHSKHKNEADYVVSDEFEDSTDNPFAVLADWKAVDPRNDE